mmetsp:Transcript_7254/g.13763  ORF Transcript_7254/g.13763 Transcript_7254/m.13763 type:complete len:431 (+) Transcript_7254:30-1322(+)
MHWSAELLKLFPIILSVVLRNLFFAFRDLFRKIWRVSAPAGKTARVERILFRKKVLSVDLATGKDFLSVHERWEDPVITLLPNVTLYSVNTTEAIFVECPADIDLTQAHDFFYAAQFENAVRVITVPLKDFHQIADKIGAPKPNQRIVHLYSVGRCGSTLLQKMMAAVPASTSLSEPDSFTMLIGMRDLLSPADFDRMLTSVSRFETKVLMSPEADINIVILKFRSQCNLQGPDVHRVLPHIRQLFMYRHAEKVAASVINTFGSLPIISILLDPGAPQGIKNFLKKSLVSMTKKGGISKGGELFSDEFLAAQSVLGLMAVSWVKECGTYLDMRASKQPIPAVRYEDLVRDPPNFFKALCDAIGLDPPSPAVVEAAVASTKVDSQSKSGISKASQKVKSFTTEDSESVRRVVSCHPKLQTPGVILEGTLLH